MESGTKSEGSGNPKPLDIQKPLGLQKLGTKWASRLKVSPGHGGRGTSAQIDPPEKMNSVKMKPEQDMYTDQAGCLPLQVIVIRYYVYQFIPTSSLLVFATRKSEA